uniref:Uncharacterized protein n=1 Tax=Anguilla anguilla TaxID=7936 RepID=A0A0E9WKG2_ANGAN
MGFSFPVCWISQLKLCHWLASGIFCKTGLVRNLSHKSAC